MELLGREARSTSEATHSGKPWQKGYFRTELVWRNIVIGGVVHALALYGAFLCFTLQVKWQTALYGIVLFVVSAEGAIFGAHRSISHKAFKMRTPLKEFMVLVAHTMSLQAPMWKWVRDHRQHHKYSDTDADPHNPSRGIFFAHVGWLLMRGHPDVREKGKTIDTSDLDSDPVVMFQKNHYFKLYFLTTGVSCFAVPMHFWDESAWMSFLIVVVLRTVIVLNVTFLINSAGHAFGNRPYDKNIRPADHLLYSTLTLGEGSHNYHHTFPWDYRASEFGDNFTTNCIHLAARLGQVYDLRMATDALIRARKSRTGESSVDNSNPAILSPSDGLYPRTDFQGPIIMKKQLLNYENNMNYKNVSEHW